MSKWSDCLFQEFLNNFRTLLEYKRKIKSNVGPWNFKTRVTAVSATVSLKFGRLNIRFQLDLEIFKLRSMFMVQTYSNWMTLHHWPNLPCSWYIIVINWDKHISQPPNTSVYGSNHLVQFIIEISKSLLARSKDLPNMNTFCDWLSKTIVISVYDLLFRNYIVLYCLKQPITAPVHLGTWRPLARVNIRNRSLKPSF